MCAEPADIFQNQITSLPAYTEKTLMFHFSSLYKDNQQIYSKFLNERNVLK